MTLSQPKISSVISRVTEKERAYVMEVLDSGFRSSLSNMMTKRLEERFAAKFNSKFAISFVNGTATMHAALVAAGVGPGDEVLVPPLTMASTSFAVLHAGATPVFCDIDPQSWTLDPVSMRERTTSRTKAVIPVSIYGLPPDMDAIMAVAKEKQLFVLEDDAQCFLGSYHGRTMGSIGHVSSFSFQSSKHMTCGEGGMVTTNDEGIADNIRRFGSLGYAAVGAGAGKGKITKNVIQDPAYERHSSVGFNYRMSELCAAVALGQLEHLEELVEMRVAIGELYTFALGDCTWLQPQRIPDGYKHSYWTFGVKLVSDAGITWHQFREKYLEYGGEGVYGAWQLTYLEPVFRGREAASGQTYLSGLCPVAEQTQPYLIQFKTNYWNYEVAQRRADALVRTVEFFGK